MTHAQRLLAFTVALALSRPSGAQRAADQAQAIADVLTVIEAQDAYAVQNCGYYAYYLGFLCSADVGCVGVGIPNYPPTGPDFIEARLVVGSPAVQSRYLRTWTHGPGVPEPAANCDPGSVIDYCYAARPQNLKRGRPSFAGTSDGTIYVDASSADIPCPVPQGTETIRWPELTYPVAGATLPASSVTFRWSANDVPVNTYRLLLGSTSGGGDIFDSGPIGEATSITVHAVPSDGSTVYASLAYRFADRWQTVDTSYTARATPSTLETPELVTPTPSSRLPGPAAMFEWTPNNTTIRQWRLLVGSRPNSANYYRSPRRVSDVSAWVDDLPTDGSLVFTRLYFRAPEGWSFVDDRYQAAWELASSTPTFTLPAPGSDLPEGSTPAAWTANDTTVKKWWLYAGSERGRNDYFNSGPLALDSGSITGLPAAGSPVYVRLWYLVGRRWKHVDFVFGNVDLAGDATTGGRVARIRRPSRRAR